MDKKTLISTAFHILELVAILCVVWLVTMMFPDLLPKEGVRDVLIVVLAGLAKFARASDSVGIKDYVNKP